MALALVVRGVPAGDHPRHHRARFHSRLLASVLHLALRGLIRGIKRDRLDELEDLRRIALAGKTGTERDGISAAFEAQRREIEQFPEQPWEASESRRAWITLFLALLAPLLASVIGQWSSSIIEFAKSLLEKS